MTPPEVVDRARAAGLDWMGVADHNAADNLEAFQRAAARSGMAFTPGLEVTSSEEIHFLVFFDDLQGAREMGRLVGERLTGENDAAAFGRQLVVDAEGTPLGERRELLIGATDLSARALVEAARGLGGLVIASHVDRPSYSVVSQLGFVPPDLELRAAELSPRCADDDAARSWSAKVGGLPLVWFSDAHRPEDVGRVATRVRAEAPTARELGRALTGEGGRGVERG